MNNVQLIGRITTAPKANTLDSGKKLCRFSLAVDGKTTVFVPCVAWDKTAELLEKYVGKGEKIGVNGRITSSSYEKDGKKVYAVDIVAEEIFFCQPKGKAGDGEVGGENDDNG